MDGFCVDTNALRRSSVGYRLASECLKGVGSRLRMSQKALESEQMPPEVAELFSSAIGLASVAAFETNDLAERCEEIADVYDEAEQRVSALVRNLSRPGSGLAPVSIAADPADFILEMGRIAPGRSARVNTPLRPVPPAIFAGGRLPCESWLLNRAIQATIRAN